MKIVERIKAPTPKFFKILRSVGLALLAISGTIVAAPIVLPVTVVTVAGYMAVAGGVISAVSQMTVNDEILRQAQEDNNKPRDGDYYFPPNWNCIWNIFEHFAQYSFGRYCKNNYLSGRWSHSQFYGFAPFKMVDKI